MRMIYLSVIKVKSAIFFLSKRVSLWTPLKWVACSFSLGCYQFNRRWRRKIKHSASVLYGFTIHAERKELSCPSAVTLRIFAAPSVPLCTKIIGRPRQLTTRIWYCIRKMDVSAVERSCESITTKDHHDWSGSFLNIHRQFLRINMFLIKKNWIRWRNTYRWVSMGFIIDSFLTAQASPNHFCSH